MPGKTGPIERRLRAVYSQVVSSIVTRALRLTRAEGAWSIRWWVTATCPGPGGPVVATRQGGGGPKGAPQPLMWQRLVVAPPRVFGPATAAGQSVNAKTGAAGPRLCYHLASRTMLSGRPRAVLCPGFA